jgi:hypothetical protein
VTVTPTNIVGVTTNSNAPTGDVGEYVTQSQSQGSPIVLTNSQVTNILQATPLVLTAGDWDVNGVLVLATLSGGTMNYMSASISLTNNNLSGDVMATTQLNYAVGQYTRLPVGPCRISLASTTTVYLVAQCGFTPGTATVACSGALRARRER